MDDDDTNDDFQTNLGDINPMAEMKDDERLPEDYDTPFSPPEGVEDRIDPSYPAADTDVDPMDDYDEGIEGAADVNLPIDSDLPDED